MLNKLSYNKLNVKLDNMIPVIQKKLIIYPEGLNGIMVFTTCGLNFGHFTGISSFLSLWYRPRVKFVLFLMALENSPER